jgi:hypothetical protein
LGFQYYDDIEVREIITAGLSKKEIFQRLRVYLEKSENNERQGKSANLSGTRKSGKAGIET